MGQDTIDARFPIWVSSIEQERLLDPKKTEKIGVSEYAEAHPVMVRPVFSNETLDAFLGRRAITLKLSEDTVDNIFRVSGILSNADRQYRAWAVEMDRDHLVAHVLEREHPENHDFYIELLWSVKDVMGVEVIMRPGTNVAEIERLAALIQSHVMTIGPRAMLVEYTAGFGYRIDGYCPDVKPPMWINLEALALGDIKICPSYAWK